MEAGSGLPGDCKLGRSARSVEEGDLPQLALGSLWADNTHQPPGLSGTAAEPGHPWGMCQTITFLIEYLINYSGTESIIHISFKQGGKSHCPLTEASQWLPRPWGLSHEQEKLSQQGCSPARLLPRLRPSCMPHWCAHTPDRTHTHTEHPGGAGQVRQKRQ